MTSITNDGSESSELTVQQRKHWDAASATLMPKLAAFAKTLDADEQGVLAVLLQRAAGGDDAVAGYGFFPNFGIDLWGNGGPAPWPPVSDTATLQPTAVTFQQAPAPGIGDSTTFSGSGLRHR